MKVDTSTFQNDMINFSDKDDVLTYLIHLGYLGYDQQQETAFVPMKNTAGADEGGKRKNGMNGFRFRENRMCNSVSR